MFFKILLKFFLITGILSQLTFNVVFANQIAFKYNNTKFEIEIQLVFIILSTLIILNFLLFERFMFNFLFFSFFKTKSDNHTIK